MKWILTDMLNIGGVEKRFLDNYRMHNYNI